MTRVAALADIHLGHPDAPGLDWALSALRDAAAQGADVLVLAGDLIDRNHADEATVTQTEQLLRQAASTGLPVMLTWGNHDISARLPERLPTVAGVTVAPRTSVLTLTTGTRETPGTTPRVLTVHMTSVDADPDPRRPVSGFPVADGPGPHLGILHTSLTGEYSRKPCLPTTVAELESRGYGRWILGHVHHRPPVTETIGWVGMGNLLVVDL
ncbi:metallophosphoesterase [uncultured Corynebacterium sp.]|uniref:metallophosphoesterase family protein n=1 Tax=uncultured Corynebacterium sp. TaxID=159447 RepID=UPI0025F2C56D|nr:metallophosphoesterase [uncultured Corynebacterium sp.]